MTHVRCIGPDGQPTQERILCAWADCTAWGHDEIRVVRNEGRNGSPMRTQLIYVFCNQRHRLFYLQSHRAYGQLPAGSGPVPGPIRS